MLPFRNQCGLLRRRIIDVALSLMQWEVLELLGKLRHPFPLTFESITSWLRLRLSLRSRRVFLKNVERLRSGGPLLRTAPEPKEAALAPPPTPQ